MSFLDAIACVISRTTHALDVITSISRYDRRSNLLQFFLWLGKRYIYFSLCIERLFMFSVCWNQCRRRSCAVMLSTKKTRPGGWPKVSLSLCSHCKTAVPTYCGSFPALWSCIVQVISKSEKVSSRDKTLGLQTVWYGRHHSVQRDTARLSSHKLKHCVHPHTVYMCAMCHLYSTHSILPYTGGWRKLHNENVKDMCFAPYSVREVESRRMRWVKHVTRMSEMRSKCRIEVWNYEESKS